MYLINFVGAKALTTGELTGHQQSRGIDVIKT